MGTKAATGDAAARDRRIWAVVAAIPRGRVASYGEVAARAGLPRGARLVGRALAQCPAALPWHRVLGASGRISLPPGSAAFREQRRRLEREGVPVAANGRVAATHFDRDPAGLDELLWGPPPRRGRAVPGARRAP
jgi:methylated-DNA-protein-cysteine methyltransferase-like protein